MLVPAVFRVLGGVPDVCKVRHGFGLLLVEDFQELGVHRFAVPVHSPMVAVQRLSDQAFVACHDVGQVSEGLRGVPLCSNVNMNLMESNA